MDITSLIQTGTVMDVNAGKKQARVKFSENHSGWLYILQHTGAGVTTQAASGHTHNAALGTWLPQVNDRVLALYLPVSGGDGFILGVI